MPAHTVSELKKAILGYLEREQKRASTCVAASEEGSVAEREACARAHEVRNISQVIESIFAKKELELEKAKHKEGEETLPFHDG